MKINLGAISMVSKTIKKKPAKKTTKKTTPIKKTTKKPNAKAKPKAVPKPQPVIQAPVLQTTIPKCILVIPDTHFPFADWKGLEKAKAWADEHEPDLIVQLGDLLDQKAWSRWDKDPDDMSPEEEFAEAYKDVERFHKMFPKAHILTGNHDRRFYMKAAEGGLPSQLVKSMKELFPFTTEWTWHIHAKDRLIVPSARGDILFMHGDEMGGKPVAKATALGLNVVQGHTHQCSVTHAQAMDKHLFGAECGHLMDVDSKGARYSARNPKGASSGFMVIKHGIPYFIPNDDAPIA